MRKRAVAGFVTLAIGVILTGIGYQKKVAVSADNLTAETLQTTSVALFLGIALIILSAILFIAASGSKKS